MNDPRDYAVLEKKVRLKLGKRLYQGDGEIYELVNYPNRVIKIVCTYSPRVGDNLKIIKHLQKSKTPAVVRIHKAGAFKTDTGGNYYYYVMDRLKPLTGKKVYAKIINPVFHCVWDGGPPPKNALPEVKSFLKKVRSLPYHYGDIHAGNIMKTPRGALKFVDLESFH